MMTSAPASVARRRRRPPVPASSAACRGRRPRSGADHLDERGARRAGQLLVELVGDGAAHVVRLEDRVDVGRVQVWHAPNPSQEQQTSWSEAADALHTHGSSPAALKVSLSSRTV